MSQFVAKKLQEAMSGTPQGASDVKGDVIPPEVLDLVRFMCATWKEIDKFVYQYCDGDALAHYPVVQGTSNQIRLQRIGEQPHDLKNVGKAAEWLQRYNAVLSGAATETTTECGANC